MERWRSVSLGDVCHVIGGGTPSKKNRGFYTGSIPWATVRDMGSEVISETEFRITEAAVQASSTNIIPAGNVVIATRVGLGKVCLLERDTAINQDLRGVVPIRSGSILPRFLYYWFVSIAPSIVSAGTGATVQGVKVSFIKTLRIALPPLHEQKRIVAILDEAFAAIETATANAEKNLANSRELFESYLNSIDTDKAPLGELVNIKTGKLDANAAVEGGEYPFFTCAREIYSIDNYAFDCEAILLAGNNAVGDFNVKHYNGKFNAYQRTYVITVNESSRVLYRFLFFQMRKSLAEFKSRSVGAGTKFLKLGMIKSLEIALPPLAKQQQLVEKLDSLLEKTQHVELLYECKLTAFGELKKSILRLAFTGELATDPNADERSISEASV